KGGARDSAGANRINQRSFVNQAPASAVYQPHSGLHLVNRSGVYQTARLVGQRRVQRDEIGARKQLVERGHFDSKFVRSFSSEVRVVGQYVHAESSRALGDGGSDASESDDSQRFAHKLDAEKSVLLPATGPCRSGRLWNLTRERKQHSHRVLGRSDRVSC